MGTYVKYNGSLPNSLKLRGISRCLTPSHTTSYLTRLLPKLFNRVSVVHYAVVCVCYVHYCIQKG